MDAEKLLRHLGIDYLTLGGDASLSHRVLYDMAADLVPEFIDYFSLVGASFPPGWNDRNKVAIRCHPAIMVEFAKFVWRKRGGYVVHYEGAVFFVDLNYVEKWQKQLSEKDFVEKPFSHTNDAHQMSGRTI